MSLEPSFGRARNLFLRCMAAIYLSAFSSLYLQIRGLFGQNGILPSHVLLNVLDGRNFYDKYWENPTLLHLAPIFGLNVSYCMELFALIGILLSFAGLSSQRFCNSLSFLTLWLLYLSLFQVGQTFLHFQWDTMLLESGFLSIFSAPFFPSKNEILTSKDKLFFELIKWLLFRLMLASGVVKLMSNCPTWWNLSALTIHYESQCIPTTLAWYFHHLPVWFHKLSTVATFVIEIILPFLFYSPFRKLRLFSCYAQILLQVLIIASGNYNFFNFLTLTLCISLMDDRHLGRYTQQKSTKTENFYTVIVTGILIYFIYRWFGVRIGKNFQDPVRSEIKFSVSDFEAAVKFAVPASIVIGGVSFFRTAVSSIYELVFDSKSSLLRYIMNVIKFMPYLLMACLLFGISLVSFSTLDRGTQATLPSFLKDWHGQFNHFHLTGSYGLFRSMTGVDGRPEIVLEGASKSDGPWIEIPFKYKPGAVDRPCPFIVPHQPRLDWQMWFAALGNYRQNPWLVSLVYRILIDETEVIKLLDSNVYNEFEDEWPPKYIKGSLYTYHYTSPRTKIDWWKRNKVSEYLPVLSANKQLKDYLVKQNLLEKPDVEVTNKLVAGFLDSIWEICSSMEHHIFVWSLLATCLVIIRHT